MDSVEKLEIHKNLYEDFTEDSLYVKLSWTFEMFQWVNVLVTKLDNLSLIPRICVVGGEHRVLQDFP